MPIVMTKLAKGFHLDQSDIEYTLELLNDALTEKDWDKVDEARETLKEFLDHEELPLEE